MKNNLGNNATMAENIQYYMDKMGIDRNKLCDDLDLKYTTVTDWLKGKTYPRIDKIELMASYFGVNKCDLIEKRIEKENTASRLKELMKERNLRQVDIVEMAQPYCERFDVKINKSDISQYVSGKNEPSQEKLVVLGMALGVSESWLMGFDQPKERSGQPQYNERMAKVMSIVDALPDEYFERFITYGMSLLTTCNLEKEIREIQKR